MVYNSNNMLYKKIKRTKIFIFCLLISLIAIEVASDELSQQDLYILNGLQDIANYNFQSAQENFMQLYKLDTENPAPYFYFAYQILRMKDYYSEEDYQNVLKYLNYAESLADKTLAKKPDDVNSLFYKAASNALKAFVEGFKGSWWESAQAGKEMRSYSNKLLQVDPNNIDALYFLGTYNYFADILPSVQKFIRKLLFIPGGDKDKGLSQLQKAAESGRYTKIEAMQNLLLIYTYFEKNCDSAQPYAFSLIKQFPNNPYFKLVLSHCYYRQQKWDHCTAALSNIPKKYSYLKQQDHAPLFYEIEYWLARCYLHKSEFEKAFNLLNDIINEHPTKPSWLYQWSLLSTAQAYDLLNDNENALLYYNKVLSIKDYRNAHSRVKWRLKNNKPLPLAYTDY
jgi:hypothetical protein